MINVICRLTTGDVYLEYVESWIEHPILWESHCHTQFEMIAVAEGDINVMLEGKNYRLKKNQIIMIPPLSYHTVTANEQGNYRRVTALFDLSAIPSVLQDEFGDREAGVATASFSCVETLKEICRKEEPSFYAPLAYSLMIQIFYDMLKESKKTTVTKSDDFLQSVIAYIDQHLHEKIRLDDLAKHTARSKSSFCHLFEEKMNISPKQYILQKKLAVASKLIEEGVPHTVAAMQVGYENYSNFYRLYHKKTSKGIKSFDQKNGQI